MANRKSDYVVFIEQTFDNGVIVEAVRAADSGQALDAACELNDIDPLRTAKCVRNFWVVRGKLA